MRFIKQYIFMRGLPGEPPPPPADCTILGTASFESIMDLCAINGIATLEPTINNCVITGAASFESIISACFITGAASIEPTINNCAINGTATVIYN
jgi:hypothetical protein